MKKLFQRTLSILLAIAVFAAMLPFDGLKVEAVTNGVQTKIDRLLSVYPNGSYFTISGQSCLDSGYHDQHIYLTGAWCPNCYLPNIPARGGLPAGSSVGWEADTCAGFAGYVYYNIFGHNHLTQTTVYSYPSSASAGDLIHTGTHWFVYLWQDDSYYYGYDANSHSRGQTSSGVWICDQMVQYNRAFPKSSYPLKTVYHANNYNQVYNSSSEDSSGSSITPGTYFLINKHDGKALTLANNEVWNTNNVHVYDAAYSNRGQQMVISAAPDGYKIRPIDSTRLVQPYGDYVYEGANVNIYDDVNDSSQWWKFEKTEGGYFIRNAQNTNLLLTNSYPNDGNAVIWSYGGGSDQIWELVPAKLPGKPVVKGMKSSYTTSESIKVQWNSDGYNTNMYSVILFKKVNGTYTQVLLKDNISQGYSLNSDYTFGEGDYKLNVIGTNTNVLIDYGGYYMNTFSDDFVFSVKKSTSTTTSTLKVTGTKATVGGNLTISIAINDIKLSSLDFDLIYDADKLKFVGTSNVAFESEQKNEKTAGTIKASYYSSNSSHTGKLVDFTFEVIAKNEGAANIMINPTVGANEKNTIVELNSVGYTATISNSAVMLGDVDNDGRLSSRDARLAHRAAVNLENLTPTQFMAADADKDGRISSRDARLIHRAAVGLETLG